MHVIGFLHEAYFRHRAAPVFVSLRPSATVAAWHPGPAAPFRGKASVRLVCARLHPRPWNGGNAETVPATPPAASRCSHSLTTLSVCLVTAAPTQAGPPQHKPFTPSLRRQPARLRPLPSRITPRKFPGPRYCLNKQPPSPKRRVRSLPGSAVPQNISANTLAHPIIGHYAK